MPLRYQGELFNKVKYQGELFSKFKYQGEVIGLETVIELNNNAQYRWLYSPENPSLYFFDNDRVGVELANPLGVNGINGFPEPEDPIKITNTDLNKFSIEAGTDIFIYLFDDNAGLFGKNATYKITTKEYLEIDLNENADSYTSFITLDQTNSTFEDINSDKGYKVDTGYVGVAKRNGLLYLYFGADWTGSITYELSMKLYIQFSTGVKFWY